MRKERHVIYLTPATAVALADYRARRHTQFRSTSETVEHLLQRALMGAFDEGMEGLVAPVLAQLVQQAAARAVEGTVAALLATQTDRLAALLVRSDRDTIAAGNDAASAFAVATAVLEVVLGDRVRRLGELEGGRYLVRLVSHIPLFLVDLTDVRLLASLGLDERVSVGDDYATCQAWALALWQGMPEIAGIRYRARKAGATVANVALFLDRCGGHVIEPPDDARMLKGCEIVVLEATDLHNLVVKFPFR